MNVHEFDGREAFDAHFEQQIRSQSQLGEELVEHFYKMSLFFLFNEDPDKDDLETEKTQVQKESDAAYLRSAARMA